MIAEVKVTDESWIPSYAEEVWKILVRHNGKYLSRSANIKSQEGTKDLDLIVLVEFSSMKDAQNFFNDADYAPIMKARQDGSISTFTLIDDTDVTGQIPYLKKD